MKALGVTGRVVAGTTLAAAGATYAFSDRLSAIDTERPVRQVTGFAGVAAGLAVASAVVPASLRRGVPLGPLGSVAGSHAGRMMLVGSGALLAGAGLSHAFANDFPPEHMSNEGHRGTGLAPMFLGGAIATTAIPSSSPKARLARGVLGFPLVALAGYMAGGTHGDYASAGLRGAPPVPTSWF